mmetsp:Transcript_49705/g.99790  ORF Transcript_49705/g.99790 Transcript_49705/m.99790 type:complete len:184 (-) Transcript_49705:197-748(-)
MFRLLPLVHTGLPLTASDRIQTVGPGDVDVADGNYYCMSCWEAFQAAAKVETLTLKSNPKPTKGGSQSKAPQKTEMSKDEKLLSHLSKDEAMVAVLRKMLSRVESGTLSLSDAHLALACVRSHGGDGLSPGASALAQWVAASQEFVLHGRGEAASISLQGGSTPSVQFSGAARRRAERRGTAK